MEMARMAQIYQSENNFENAFILYIKFTTLFLEKIQSHPEYKAFDAATKRKNKEKIKEIFPIAERLKAKLLERFQREYELYSQAETQQKLEREKETARIEREKVRNWKHLFFETFSEFISSFFSFKELNKFMPAAVIPNASNITNNSDLQPKPSAPDLLDQVVYPNDFPTGPNKSNLPNSGLLLPDSHKAMPPKYVLRFLLFSEC